MSIKLKINSNYLMNLTDKANEILEEIRLRQLAGPGAALVPTEPVMISLVEVEAVLLALYSNGEWKPAETAK